jgi:hypothetical protein
MGVYRDGVAMPAVGPYNYGLQHSFPHVAVTDTVHCAERPQQH